MAYENGFLRLASGNDFEELYYIYMYPEINRFLNFEIMDKESFKLIFDELLHSGSMYVYEYNHQIISTCIVMRQKRRANHVASLGTLATHPAFQNRGFGTKFMHALFFKLRKNDIKRIDLCAEADNPIAIGFYKKLGFQVEGILKKYFKRLNEDNYIDEYMLAMIIE